MKKLLTMLLLLAIFCTALAVQVWAETPYSDEIGDYYYEELTDTKAYFRFNPNMVAARIEEWKMEAGCGDLAIYDLNGNRLTLSYQFDVNKYPQFIEIIDEYKRENTVVLEDGSEKVPYVYIEGYATLEYMHEAWGDHHDVYFGDENGGASSPSTGSALSLLPAFAGLALTAISKKRK